MLSTLSTLGAAQAGRAASLPRRVLETPVRTTILEAIRQRNAVLDAVVYDVKRIGEDEAVATSPWLAAEAAGDQNAAGGVELSCRPVTRRVRLSPR